MEERDKKIMIGGSMVFVKEMSNTKMQLEKMGYEVYINEQGSTSLISR